MSQTQTMTTDQATFLLHDLYMGTLKTESRTTKKILEAVPANKVEYKPDPASRSAIELARHIAAADNRFVETVINGVFDTNPAMIPAAADNRFVETVINGVFDTNPAMIPGNVKTPAEIASWYEERYAKNFEALAKVSGDQLVKIVDFRGMFQWPAVKFVMFGLHHTIHHRGQLSSYLRCMGAKVPAIYGESYDSALAKKATG